MVEGEDVVAAGPGGDLHQPDGAVGGDPVLGVGDAVAEVEAAQDGGVDVEQGGAGGVVQVGVGDGVAEFDEPAGGAVLALVGALAGDGGEDRLAVLDQGFDGDLVAVGEFFDQQRFGGVAVGEDGVERGGVVDPFDAGTGLAVEGFDDGRVVGPGGGAFGAFGRREQDRAGAPVGEVAALEQFVAADPAGPQAGGGQAEQVGDDGGGLHVVLAERDDGPDGVSGGLPVEDLLDDLLVALAGEPGQLGEAGQRVVGLLAAGLVEAAGAGGVGVDAEHGQAAAPGGGDQFGVAAAQHRAEQDHRAGLGRCCRHACAVRLIVWAIAPARSSRVSATATSRSSWPGAASTWTPSGESCSLRASGRASTGSRA